jgi:hypothetical protein
VQIFDKCLFSQANVCPELDHHWLEIITKPRAYEQRGQQLRHSVLNSLGITLSCTPGLTVDHWVLAMVSTFKTYSQLSIKFHLYLYLSTLEENNRRQRLEESATRFAVVLLPAAR